MIEIDINQQNATKLIADQLKSMGTTVVVCIGTEKVVADSLGPRVGTLLNENLTKPLYVYGLEGANIHAQNLTRAVDIVKRLHPNAKVLVVDAAVGDDWQVGKVQLIKGNIAPGAATNKQLGLIGDIGIVGIVSNKDMADFYQNSAEKSILVENLSQFIARAILVASKMC